MKKPTIYTPFSSRTLGQVQLRSKSSLTVFIYVGVKVVQLCGQKNSCLATLSCQSFMCPECSEPHVRASCTDGRGSDL